jgi:orotate phosphoribosyltransferase
MQDQVLALLSVRTGHFRLESGHHGDLWLDLETLCRRPRAVQALAAELAARLAPLSLDAVCGPLVEGAFIALLTASALDVEFTYAERFARPAEDGLFPAGYRIPSPLRAGLAGRRVGVVNDVINAGSAVRGAVADLQACGAQVVAIASLLVLGEAAEALAGGLGVPLISLARRPNRLWTPALCPLCAAGAPLEDVADFAASLPG